MSTGDRIPLSEVTKDLIEKATRAYLTHPLVGHDPKHFEALSYPTQVAESFWSAIHDPGGHSDGFRFGIVGWGHAKWRYRLDQFVSPPTFHFVVYHNSYNTKDESKIREHCRQIAEDLTKQGFPTEAD